MSEWHATQEQLAWIQKSKLVETCQELSNLAAEILGLSEEIAAGKNDLRAAREEMELSAFTIQLNGVAGKNADERAAALKVALAQNEQHQKIVARMNDLENAIAVLSARLEGKIAQAKALRATIEAKSAVFNFLASTSS